MRMEDLMPGCKVDIRITQLMEKEVVDAAQGSIIQVYLM